MNVNSEMIKLYAKQLKMPTFNRYETIIRQLDPSDGYEKFLIELMKQELAERQEVGQSRRIRNAEFPILKTLDEFDMTRLEYVDKAYINELASCDFIKNRQNIVRIGNPGAGKTHLSIALGMKACYAGFKVKFCTALNLANELAEAMQFNRLTAGENLIKYRPLNN